MKYCHYCFICIFLLICLIPGCKSPTEQNSSIVTSSGELSIVQIYNIIKDYDYWYYSFDGRVKAFKGDKKISVQGERRICDVQFIDGWIYFVKAYNDYSSDFGIFRIRSNGEDFSLLLSAAELKDDSGSSFHSLAFVGGYMYVQKGFQFYRYNLQSGQIDNLDGDVEIYHIANNQLYFIGHARKDFTIYVMNLETKETKILLGDGTYADDKKYRYSNFIFIGDRMYYYMRTPAPGGLYSYQNGKDKLIDDNSRISEYSLFEHDGKLYYMVWGDKTDKLMQYDPTTETTTEILTCNDFGSAPKIVDGCFYYLDSKHQVRQIKL